ncbi:snc nuclease-like protein [Bacteriophage sp.]|nr:snc nuclease-like protein [Bacteriophage sp.]
MCLIFFILTLFPQATPLPPFQETWTDGVLSGSRLNLFLYLDPTRPDERSLYECRLAGVAEVRDPADIAGSFHYELLRRLYDNGTNALAYSTSGQTLYARTIGAELYEKCDQSTQFAPGCKQFARYVVILEAQQGSVKRVDVATQMLRAGLLYLSRGYALELNEKEAKPYVEAQQFAESRKYGVWRFDPEIWRRPELPRIPRTRPRYPVNK